MAGFSQTLLDDLDAPAGNEAAQHEVGLLVRYHKAFAQLGDDEKLAFLCHLPAGAETPRAADKDLAMVHHLATARKVAEGREVARSPEIAQSRIKEAAEYLRPVFDEFLRNERLAKDIIRIEQELTAVFLSHDVSDEDRAAILKGMFNNITRKLSGTQLPTRAPEQWADRTTGRAENPVDFIKRVYAPWLGKGLTRPDIHALDLRLYNALAAWTRRHGWPSDLNLPKRSDVITQALEQTPPSDLEEARRLATAARMRRLRAGHIKDVREPS